MLTYDDREKRYEYSCRIFLCKDENEQRKGISPSPLHSYGNIVRKVFGECREDRRTIFTFFQKGSDRIPIN